MPGCPRHPRIQSYEAGMRGSRTTRACQSSQPACIIGLGERTESASGDGAGRLAWRRPCSTARPLVKYPCRGKSVKVAIVDPDDFIDEALSAPLDWGDPHPDPVRDFEVLAVHLLGIESPALKHILPDCPDAVPEDL